MYIQDRRSTKREREQNRRDTLGALVCVARWWALYVVFAGVIGLLSGKTPDMYGLWLVPATGAGLIFGFLYDSVIQQPPPEENIDPLLRIQWQEAFLGLVAFTVPCGVLEAGVLDSILPGYSVYVAITALALTVFGLFRWRARRRIVRFASLEAGDV